MTVKTDLSDALFDSNQATAKCQFATFLLQCTDSPSGLETHQIPLYVPAIILRAVSIRVKPPILIGYGNIRERKNASRHLLSYLA